MRVDDIKRLIELVEQSQIDELEVRRWWNAVRISKVRRGNGQSDREEIETRVVRPSSAPPPVGAPEVPGGEPDVMPPVEETEEGLVPILSPMVGTYYQAPSPTAPPYIEVGGRVSAGQIVCIIEAMKLMNEIESEISGTIAKILSTDEQPVEFNQPLFLVRPDA